MEALLNYIFMCVLMSVVFLFAYVGFHMSLEKEKGDYIPLIWEKGGLLYNLFNRKSK